MTSPRRRAVIVGLAAATVVLAVGAILMRLGSPGGNTETAGDQGAAPAPAAERAANGDGETDGFSQDEAGAVSAAISYSSASQRWLYLSDDEVADAVAEVAAPQSTEQLTAEVVRDTRAAREELAQAEGRVWWLVHPLAWRAESYADSHATVSVWTVTVLSASGVAVPQSEWMTVTMDLEWVQGDWRVQAVRERPGPTPMTSPVDEPWDAEPFDEGLDGFTRLAGDEGPPT